jgi:NAD(P)-dependent dehydrogenase (short-subunit alcohol dehydrogenase family)
VTDQPLADKVALVTGAASSIGLGYAMTAALLSAGAKVAMVDFDSASLESSAADMRKLSADRSVAAIVADATKPEDAENAAREAIRQLGGLHILVNNAGINPRFNFADVPVDAWLKTIATNVHGPFLMAKAVVPYLRQQGWGRVIGVTTSLDTMLRSLPYGPSKAAHEAFVAVLAAELEGTGVTANVLVPGGAVDTAMTRGQQYTSLLEPQVMQAPVVWLASEESNAFNGRRITARHWDETLPVQERLAKASAPAGWPQLGRPIDER